MSQGICTLHGQVEITWKEGKNKQTGKTYAFWKCVKNELQLDGSYPKCQVTPANTPSGQFAQSLDKSAAQMDNHTKDETITRIAIAKSLIERGAVWNMATVAEAEKVLSWVTGKNKALVEALLKGQAVGVAEAITKSERIEPAQKIPLDEIPFM